MSAPERRLRQPDSLKLGRGATAGRVEANGLSAEGGSSIVRPSIAGAVRRPRVDATGSTSPPQSAVFGSYPRIDVLVNTAIGDSGWVEV